MLLLPLAIHRAVLALSGSAWLVASQARYLPRLAAQWALGLAASAALWLVWLISGARGQSETPGGGRDRQGTGAGAQSDREKAH